MHWKHELMHWKHELMHWKHELIKIGCLQSVH